MLEAIWPHIVHENNLDQAISTVRRALGETQREHRFIVTAPGRGYRFVARVETIAAEDAAASVAATATATDVPRPAATLAAAVPAIAAVFAIAAAAVFLGTRGAVLEPPALRAQPLSSEKGGQRSAVWSPDGAAIALAARSTPNEPFQLYVRTSGSPVARPIPLATNAVVKQWTTKGRILFLNERGLWSVAPVGRQPELVAPLDMPADTLADARMDVMRDGSAVAMLWRDENGVLGVWTASFPGARLERYEPAPFSSRRFVNAPFLRFSPDGTQLLLMWNPLEGEQAWLMPYTEEDFPGETQWFMAPALSPDGTRVIYHRVEGPDSGSSHLWMSEVSGGRPERVTNEDTSLEAAGSWSPDGAWYAYTTPGSDGQGRALKKVRTTGRAEPEIILSELRSSSALGSRLLPVWSPDGDWILIANEGMMLVSPDGATTRDLGIDEAACTFARIENLLYCIGMPQQDRGYRSWRSISKETSILSSARWLPSRPRFLR